MVGERWMNGWVSGWSGGEGERGGGGKEGWMDGELCLYLSQQGLL